MTNLGHLLTDKIFHTVGEIAANEGRECYVVGGYVRDAILHRHSKDIDFVTVGSGIELATAVASHLGKGSKLSVFRNYGTAQIVNHRSGLELEFVGARKESYHRESRNPVVEDGSLEDDISRRDFTINAMAISVTPGNFGELIDMFGGVDDICDRIIRTPLDPDITFSDDPLRMMRAIRFATQLQFDIHPDTFEAIKRNAPRLEIITSERIKDELMKIMASPKPSIGWDLLLRSGLLKLIMPELAALKGVDVVNGRGHKDNFYHTIEVLDNVAAKSDKIWLRWAALLHDIGKPLTKKWDETIGWTFHNHNFIGAKKVKGIFKRLCLPLGAEMKYVEKLVDLHMRPIVLAEDEVTDSAVRRLVNYAENDLDDLMILARADITSKNMAKKQKFLDNFDIVDAKCSELIAKDKDRAFRPKLNGNDLKLIFGIPQGKEVGFLMTRLTKASKDCSIDDTVEAAVDYVIETAKGINLSPVGLEQFRKQLANPTDTLNNE
ncbi:MAG: CCA tRNA nucleotidyltransferase [Muribaculaceae bacterium]|nr:CCA tRNA nucleotidyltransferase [Muribaculaceae bacterium]